MLTGPRVRHAHMRRDFAAGHADDRDDVRPILTLSAIIRSTPYGYMGRGGIVSIVSPQPSFGLGSSPSRVSTEPWTQNDALCQSGDLYLKLFLEELSNVDIEQMLHRL